MSSIVHSWERYQNRIRDKEYKGPDSVTIDREKLVLIEESKNAGDNNDASEALRHDNSSD